MIFLVFAFVAELDTIHATHGSKVSNPCSVRLQSQMLPVLYEGQPRNNPDKTYYPADAFYYIIQFSASPTCVGLDIDKLKSHDGLDVQSHEIVTWRSLGVRNYEYAQADPIESATPHKHVSLERKLKHLEITHYYRGEGLLFSIKEGESLSVQQKKQFERAGGNGNTKQTKEWGFLTSSLSHVHYPECTSRDLRNADKAHSGDVLEHGNRLCKVPDAYVDNNSQNKFEDTVKKKCSTFKVYSGCIFGKVIIEGDVAKPRCLYTELEKRNIDRSKFPDSDECISMVQTIQQKVTGLKKTCSKDFSGNTICRNIPIVRTVELKPDILVPELDVFLAEEILKDSDGYDAINLDGTHYVWDPITIHHIPELKWKNNRDNTIHFDVQKIPDLRIENELDCDYNSCRSRLIHPGTTPSTWDLGNGDGLTIYNATDSSDLGWNDFAYNVTAYNGDAFLAGDYDTIGSLVVKYAPKYSQYPYSVLSDDNRTSYENRAGVALHYFGSQGGGPDDASGLHEDRRSKINGYAYAGVGFDPWTPVFLNGTLGWSEAQDVGILYEHGQFVGNDTIPSGNDLVIPCEAYGDTAMLVRAGYCKVYFDYPILDIVLDSAGPRYENATLFNTLISDHFAGWDPKYLLGYEYIFPESLFHTNLNVRSVGDNGTVNDIPIRVDIIQSDDDNAHPIQKYIREKITYDSGDPGFGTIISDDVYPVEYSESGTGELDVKLRRIVSKFETYQNDQNRNLTGTDIVNLSSLYFENSKNARLDVPYHVGLGALAPMTVNVTANGLTRQYDYDYIDFGTEDEILINAAQNNTLEISRYRGSITITPDASFGDVAGLYVNGRQINTTCGATCVIGTPDNSQVQITVENFWGGRAHAIAPEFVPEETPSIPSSNLFPLVLFALCIVPIYWMYNRVKNRK